MLGGDLTNERKRAICEVLKANLDLFDWKPADMIEVPRTLVEHKLGVKEGTPPVRKKKRGQAPKRKIGWKVEYLCGYPIKCFLDAYKGYHQIQMAEEDEEKTAFHSSQGVFYYTKIPFGLKNASATYQRHSEAEVVRDIEETFRTLRKINMKLNPKKCTFGAAEGAFMGNNIGREGIQACNEKTQAVINMPDKRFLSKAAEKSLPFFKTLKRCIKKSDFVWTKEAERALKDMKKQIAELPTLTAPVEWEMLIMYLSTAEEDVSVVLLAERGNRQMSIYFVGRALQSLKVNYIPMEKLILALVHAKRRLRRYFQAYPVAVEEAKASEEVAEVWKLFIDGSSNEGGSRAGLILTYPDSVEFTHALRFEFKASNNEVEYEALLAGLRIANNKQPLPSKRRSDATVYEQSKGSGSTLQIIFNNTSTKKPEQASRRSKQNGLHKRGRRHVDDANKRVTGKGNIARRKGKSTAVKDKSKAICDVGRNSIPKVITRAIAKVCWPETSQLRNLRDTRRFLQRTLRPPVNREKSNADGRLLADVAHGRPDGNQSVAGMSSTQTHTTSPKN
ncbi:reverse transcriptase domain-containing protein [Tanacetum coccineum]